MMARMRCEFNDKTVLVEQAACAVRNAKVEQTRRRGLRSQSIHHSLRTTTLATRNLQLRIIDTLARLSV